MDKDLNRKIYDTLIEYAHTVFPLLDMKEEGTFTTAQLAQNWVMDEKKKCKTPIYYILNNLIDAEPVTFTIDTFRMTFKPHDVFRIAWQFESLAGIKQADKERFTNVEEGRALIKFDLPKEARRIVKSCAKKDFYPALKGVFADVENKCIVATNQHLVQVYHLPEMEVAPEANGTIISAKVFSSMAKHIIVTDKYATNGTDSAENLDGRYPNYNNAIPKYGENQKIDLRGAWKDIREAVTACKKNNGGIEKVIVLSGKKGSSSLKISTKDVCYENLSEKIVTLCSPIPFDFYFGAEADFLLNITNADSLYLRNAKQPMLFTSKDSFTVLCPKCHNEYKYGGFTWNIDPINPRSPLDICGFTPAPSAAPAAPHIIKATTHLLPPPQVMLFSHLFVFVWDTSEAQSEAA